MRLLFLHKYGHRAASFRHRFEQYLPYLERAGFECTLSSLFDDDYLDARMTTGYRNFAAMAKGALRQLGHAARARDYDLVIIGIELFPFLPPIVERYFNLRRIPYVFDFDDPIFHYYDLSPSLIVRTLLGAKIRTVAAGASYVFAGSPYLVDYVRQVNPAVEYLPTVIDLDRYPTTHDFTAPSKAPFTIGWIGSLSTAPNLAIIARALERFCRRRNARVVLVGSGPVDLPGPPIEVREWSEARETSDLLEFDVGLMPLTDDAWSRGKCGFKLVQYMASGIPVIASPVGVNCDMVEPGVNGFLASEPQQWEDVLEQLANDRALCARFGAAGRARVQREYCVQALAPRFIAGVQTALRTAGKID
ncbi:MAG TPA: glycosyltransferase family 4 protein [Pseudolabrys sp.]|jgi:glycosyltransferase involved in cell wall biosynthesis